MYILYTYFYYYKAKTKWIEWVGSNNVLLFHKKHDSVVCCYRTRITQLNHETTKTYQEKRKKKIENVIIYYVIELPVHIYMYWLFCIHFYIVLRSCVCNIMIYKTYILGTRGNLLNILTPNFCILKYLFS